MWQRIKSFNECSIGFIGYGFHLLHLNEAFYSFFETHKHDQELTYSAVLKGLYSAAGRVERSFSSKIPATIRPDYPIWDKYVLDNLGIKAPLYGAKDFAAIASLYESICSWYQTDDAKQKVKIFDAHFPDIQITDTKKIDFILWQTR